MVETQADLSGKKRELRDAKGRFGKGNCANPGGRGAGVRDKANQIKAAIMEAFEKSGGIKEFVKWGQLARNKKEFYKIVVSILPKDVQVEGEGLGGTKIIIVNPPNYKAEAVKNEGIKNRVEALSG